MSILNTKSKSFDPFQRSKFMLKYSDIISQFYLMQMEMISEEFKELFRLYNDSIDKDSMTVAGSSIF